MLYLGGLILLAVSAVFPFVGVGTWGAHVGEQPLNMPFYSSSYYYY